MSEPTSSDPHAKPSDKADPQVAPADELAGTEQPFVQHLVELRDRLVKAVGRLP